jgi:biopolymer transport protein ExbB
MPTSIPMLIEHGGLTVIPLVICSIITLAVFLERLWAYRGAERGTRVLASRIMTSLADKDIRGARAVCDTVRSPASGIFREALSIRRAAPERVAQLIDSSRTLEIQRLKERLWILGTIGSMAPFIGLFGTVVGIIKSFQQMAVTGSGGFTVVAAGISEALIATAAGLVVAVFAIVAYNYLMVRANRIATQVRVSCQSLTGALSDFGEARGDS